MKTPKSTPHRTERLALIEACNALHPRTPYSFDSCVTNREMREELANPAEWARP